MVLVDTPGYNDSDHSEGTDVIITSKIINYLRDNQILTDKGISSIVQCIMIPKSGRIANSAVKVMSNML